MSTHADKKGQPGQGSGKEYESTGASPSSQADQDDDVTRMNTLGDLRSSDSGNQKTEGENDDRLRDGT